jgi:DNA-binding FadR family transcriptional regulator
MQPKPQTLTEQVATQLIAEISCGTYPVSTKLPSGKVLAEIYGVSQAVIREVTERLRAQGFVDTRQGIGCTVKSRTSSNGFQVRNMLTDDRSELSSIYELRLNLESTAAALAAVRHTGQDLAALTDILQKLEKNLYDPEQGVEFDTAFHASIAIATHNRYYANLLQYLNLEIHQVVRTARTNTLRHTGLTEQVHQEHVAVFNAIKSRDPLSARRSALSHLLHAADRLGLVLSGQDIIAGAITPISSTLSGNHDDCAN